MTDCENESLATMAQTYSEGFGNFKCEKETPREVSEHLESQTSAAESGVQNSN